jgi:hypothetical protein
VVELLGLGTTEGRNEVGKELRMKTLKRILGNIQWLCNHPPTDMTNQVPTGTRCFHCGAESGLLNLTSWAVCWGCVRKALESGLEGK